MRKKPVIFRLFLLLASSVLLAVNVNTFVSAGGLFPGGFMGLTLLLQAICEDFGGFSIPFTLINYALNAVPAVICFRLVGKKFTLYSILVVAVSSVLVDIMPSMFYDFLTSHDVLLCAVFGGLLNAFAISLALYADSSTGGTDFIAITISEKYRRDAWNHILVGNCVILAIAGFIFGLDIALYSAIFQFATTMALGTLYKEYQQRTLLIITSKPDEVYEEIRRITNHAATSFDGIGKYEKKSRTLLYSVVTASAVKELIPAIKKIDSGAFINVIKTEQLNGRFYQRPKG